VGGDVAPDPRYFDELLRRQDELCREAEEVLAELHLRERLERLGPVEPVGSSVSGLMVWRDLDVLVRCSDPPVDEVLEVLRPLLAEDGVREVLYRPETGSRSPSGGWADERWYVVLRYESRRGAVWKIDVSLWRFGDAPRTLYFPPRELAAELSDETRSAILWIKDVWHRVPAYPETVSAVEVYDAVLRHGVRSPAEFAQYLQARGLPAES
jgi:hypothetical protein